MPFSILDPLEWTEWLIFTLWNTWSLSELRKQPSRRLFLPLRRTELVPVGGHGEQIGWKFKPFPTRLFKILAWVVLVNLKKAQRVIFLWNFEHTAVCHQWWLPTTTTVTVPSLLAKFLVKFLVKFLAMLERIIGGLLILDIRNLLRRTLLKAACIRTTS